MKLIVSTISLAFSSVLFASPTVMKIECRPDRHYSGGFDFYKVTILSERGQEAKYDGEQWFQKTRPHGGRVGNPELVNKIDLIPNVENESVRLSGFNNSDGIMDDLVLPAKITNLIFAVNSKLFYNDLTFEEGTCRVLPN